MYCRSIFLETISSPMWWCWIFMYFLRAWKTGLWAKAIYLSLLPLREMGVGTIEDIFGAVRDKVFTISSSCFAALALICSVLRLLVTLILAYWPLLSSSPIYVSNSLIQVNFFATKISATYSASVDDKTTVTCLFELHLASLPFNIKIKPETDLVMALSLAQSESK